VLPAGVDARLDWTPPAVFGLLAGRGGVPPEEMERVFNMGVGMVAVLGRADAGRALGMLATRRVPAWVIGEVVPGAGSARLTGRHAR
jgi:phosphoribosylformylglycinamidine cyclo-ligase